MDAVGAPLEVEVVTLLYIDISSVNDKNGSRIPLVTKQKLCQRPCVIRNDSLP